MYMSTQNNPKRLRRMDGISLKCTSMYLDCANYDEINIHFWYDQNHVTNRI